MLHRRWDERISSTILKRTRGWPKSTLWNPHLAGTRESSYEIKDGYRQEIRTNQRDVVGGDGGAGRGVADRSWQCRKQHKGARRCGQQPGGILARQRPMAHLAGYDNRRARRKLPPVFHRAWVL